MKGGLYGRTMRCELFGKSEQLMKGEMGKMKITYHEVASEVENLARELKRHGNEALSHKDKIAVSDLLAETVQMIRRKYEITTMYYLASEVKAADGVGPAEKDTSVEAEWEPYVNPNDESDESTVCCSSCMRVSDWPSPFCPVCGRRMV